MADLRDVIAHGRVYYPAADPSVPLEGPPLILKFDKPRDGQVRLSFSQWATVEWLTERIFFASEMTGRILAASELGAQ